MDQQLPEEGEAGGDLGPHPVPDCLVDNQLRGDHQTVQGDDADERAGGQVEEGLVFLREAVEVHIDQGFGFFKESLIAVCIAKFVQAEAVLYRNVLQEEP